MSPLKGDSVSKWVESNKALWCPGTAAQVAVEQHPHLPWLLLSIPLGRKYFGLNQQQGCWVQDRRAGLCWPSTVTHWLLLLWCTVLQHHCSFVITASVSRLSMIRTSLEICFSPLYKKDIFCKMLCFVAEGRKKLF